MDGVPVGKELGRYAFADGSADGIGRRTDTAQHMQAGQAGGVGTRDVGVETVADGMADAGREAVDSANPPDATPGSSRSRCSAACAPKVGARRAWPRSAT